MSYAARMRDAICPKCGESTVYTTETGIGIERAGNKVAVTLSRKQWRQKSSATTDYVCVSCGYYERYLTDRGLLDRIAAEWAPAKVLTANPFRPNARSRLLPAGITSRAP